MRIATFNVENLDDEPPSSGPSFEERAAILRPTLERIRADILCLQEVHGQKTEGGRYKLRALDALLAGTSYADYELRSTKAADGEGVDAKRNLVTLIAPGYAFRETKEVMHEHIDPPSYRMATAEPPQTEASPLRWERPLLYTKIEAPGGAILHVMNVHFKSKLPTKVPGQKLNQFAWKTAAAWAEGFFVSSMKRVGAAIEARTMVDKIFDDEPEARIVLSGDLNAETNEVPVQALRGEVDETGNPALNGRMLYPCENSVPESARFTLYHRGRKTMLDHILVSRAMLSGYRGAEIHNEIVRDESIAFATDKKHPQSDHAPVVAIFDA